MRIAVYPHDMEIGGSQLNAIEIAAEVQRRGHPTVIVGRPGALVARVQELGLEFVELPAPSKRPSRRVAMAIRRLVHDRELDIVHGYEWPPTLEALWAGHGRRAATVSTVMSMAVAPFIPKTVPLLVGTEQIAAAEREFGRLDVGLLEPPVDLDTNDPRADNSADAFRAEYDFTPEDILIVVVTRLAHQLKLEGLLTAMTAVGRVGRPARLVIVGDGPAHDEVHAAADAANARFGAGTVTLTGQLADPRPAYAAADITIGMGGSALRALAFAKPLVVQGEQGFFKLLTPASVDEFLWAGWYGRGAGAETGADTLATELAGLVDDASRRAELGAYGRRLIEDRFSVVAAADRQIACYKAALTAAPPPSSLAWHETVGGFRYVGYYVAKRIRRALGKEGSDDFNVRPVSGRTPAKVPVAS